MRAVLTCVLIWLGAGAVAATGCLRPIDGTVFDPKAGGLQALCIATARYSTIPGYPKLLVHRDSCGLRTIEDDRLVALEAEYPHAALWAYRNYDVAQDGTVYGYGAMHPRRIYRMRPDEERFKALPIDGYVGAEYDARSDRILLRYEDRPLQEWSAAHGVRASSLAGLTYERDDVLPRYFEAVKGYLSFSEGRLFWRPEIGGEWQRVRLGLFDRHRPDDLWMLQPWRSYLDAASGVFAVQFSNDLLVFEVRDGGPPEFLYAVRGARDVFHLDDGPIVTVTGGLLLTETKTDHRVHLIARDGPRLVQAEDAVSGGTADALAIPKDGVLARGYVNPPLFRVQDAWMLFDGTRFLAAPELGRDRTGPYPRWTQWGDRLFVLDRRGWWAVQHDTTLVPGELPVSYEAPYELSPAVSRALDVLVVAPKDQGLWISRDGLRFAAVDTGDVTIRRYVTDMPGAAAGIVLAEDRLYLLDAPCVEAAFAN